MITGDIMLWRTVGTKIFPGQTQDGSWPSSLTRPRRGAFVDIRISLVLVSGREKLVLLCCTYFVRTMSRGASARPAIAAAPTAIPRDDQGYGESTISSPTPMILPIPGSGALNTAERKLLAQFSKVRSKTLYMNVEFDPFHTPHAPSFVHSWPIISSMESDCFKVSWFGPGEPSAEGKT